jgi:hypothetical protein
MCRLHWYMVPKELRDQVWASWQSGEGAFSSAHRKAVNAAVDAVLAAIGAATGRLTAAR